MPLDVKLWYTGRHILILFYFMSLLNMGLLFVGSCADQVQSGWRLEYCAMASNSTYCPDSFEEFFKQRRRWIPSTLANQVLLLKEWNTVSSRNTNISFMFRIYQALLLFSTLVNPAVSILLIVGMKQLYD